MFRKVYFPLEYCSRLHFLQVENTQTYPFSYLFKLVYIYNDSAVFKNTDTKLMYYLLKDSFTAVIIILIDSYVVHVEQWGVFRFNLQVCLHFSSWKWLSKQNEAIKKIGINQGLPIDCVRLIKCWLN